MNGSRDAANTFSKTVQMQHLLKDYKSKKIGFAEWKSKTLAIMDSIIAKYPNSKLKEARDTILNSTE